jgi:hypothetical protein
MIKINKLKMDLSKVTFKNPENVRDGTNGKILESAMREQGYPVDPRAVVDLPGINPDSPGVEVKSRSATTNSAHTVGTMTYDNILSTAWPDTSFMKKLLQQWQVEISKNIFTGEIGAGGTMVDLTHLDIQKQVEEAYESCRAQLAAQGTIVKGQTISGGQYGVLEHKPGKSGTNKSYAMRIPAAGMKKIRRSTDSTFRKLFNEV